MYVYMYNIIHSHMYDLIQNQPQKALPPGDDRPTDLWSSGPMAMITAEPPPGRGCQRLRRSLRPEKGHMMPYVNGKSHGVPFTAKLGTKSL